MTGIEEWVSRPKEVNVVPGKPFPTSTRTPGNDTYLVSFDGDFPPLNSTTSFLTATTLIYAIRAGITAGAGTRLVL